MFHITKPGRMAPVLLQWALMTVAFWTEMTVRIYRLVAQRADGPSLRDDFLDVVAESLHLTARRPKAGDGSQLGIFFCRRQFLNYQNQRIFRLVVTQPDLADDKRRLQRVA